MRHYSRVKGLTPEKPHNSKVFANCVVKIVRPYFKRRHVVLFTNDSDDKLGIAWHYIPIRHALWGVVMSRTGLLLHHYSVG